MTTTDIILICIFASGSFVAVGWVIIYSIRLCYVMKKEAEVEKHRNENRNLYFTFESDDDKTIKAFRIVVAKNVNTQDFIECCERYTDPLFEYNNEHCSLSEDEFNLLKEVLLK